MKRIAGVNGIATHGELNIDVLLARLSAHGLLTIDIPLPKRHFVSAWWGHKIDVERIYKGTVDGDIVVAHSFGCQRVAEAMKYRKFEKVFMIRPAMDRGYRFDRDGVYCFHSKDDLPLKIGSFLPCHPFGKAGLVGFDDKSVMNIKSEGHHNADFEERLDKTVEIILNECGI